MTPAANLRLDIDLDALAANWRWFRERSHGADCGAAVKADGYGLGARAVVDRLAREGCRDFFVTTFREAEALGQMPEGATLHALHGPLDGDAPGAAVPVLNSPEQIARWKAMAPGQPCDVMVDTGMNRLGIDWRHFSADMLEGLTLGTLHSHLACADEPMHPMNRQQLERFRDIVDAVRPPRASLAGSGGVCLGADYAFGLTRPGLGLYGGVPGPAAAGRLSQVVRPHAEIIMIRSIEGGDSVGYGATWTASGPRRIATINLGYADGYLRSFSNAGAVIASGTACPVVGRVSMDLICADVTEAEPLAGDWVELSYDLPTAARTSGLSQYELLTGLGCRYQRRYR